MIALTAAYVNRYAKICSPHIFTSGIHGTADGRLRSLRGGVSCGPEYDAEPEHKPSKRRRQADGNATKHGRIQILHFIYCKYF